MARLPIALGNNEDEIVGLGVMNLQPSPQSWQIQREQPATRSSRTVQSGRAGAVTEGTFWTDEWLKGWAASLALHAALLTSLGLWYFVPPQPRVITIDSRLAGSPSGSLEGTELVGELGSFPDDLSLVSQSAVENPEIDMSFEGLRLDPLRTLTDAGDFVASPRGNREAAGDGDGDGFGLARFGEGGETIRGVPVKVGDPQFTLLWDTDADLDLHVIEPGGKEIYWESPKGAHGGELDVDNTKGFGPENIYWLVESEEPGSGLVKGPGPPGIYQWFVVYWGGFGGIPKPTHWKVRIKHGGTVKVVHGKFRALNERSRIYTLTIPPDRTRQPRPVDPSITDLGAP